MKVHVDYLLSSNAQDIIDPKNTRMADDFAPDAGTTTNNKLSSDELYLSHTQLYRV